MKRCLARNWRQIDWLECSSCRYYSQTAQCHRDKAGGSYQKYQGPARQGGPKGGKNVVLPRTNLFQVSKNNYKYDLSAIVETESNGPSSQLSDLQEPTEYTVGEPLRPGDYIESRAGYGTIIIDGIVIGADRSSPNVYITMGKDGLVTKTYLESVVLHIPRLIEDQKLLRAAFAEYVKGHFPRKAASVAAQLCEFLIEVESVKHAWGPDFGEKIYLQLRSARSDKSRSLTLSEIVETATCPVDQPVPQNVLDLAVHREITKLGMRFRIDEAQHWLTRRYELRPHQDLESYQQILNWCRHDTAIINEFANTAKIVAAKMTELGSREGHVRKCQSELAFSKRERLILEMLLRSLVSRRQIQVNDERALAQRILRFCDISSEEISDSEIEQFLRNIGVLSPWHTALTLDRVWDLPEYSKDESVEKSLSRIPEEVDNILACSPIELDAFSSSRHDFGDLPVYIIDDAGSTELDDGCSIEYTPDGNWLHIHIADPTSQISVSSEISTYARRQATTLYFLDRHVPMLPQRMVADRLTLHESDGNTRPQQVLTTSLKVGEDGSIIDYRVRPALINNARTLRYGEADDLLGGTAGSPAKPLVVFPYEVTKENDPLPRRDTIDTSARADLPALLAISRQLFSKRFQNGAFWLSSRSNTAKIFGIEPFEMSLSAPTVWQGSPSIAFFESTTAVRSPSRDMIAEFAIAVGSVTSKFATERHVPVIHRSQRVPQSARKEVEVLLSLRDEFGQVDAMEAREALGNVAGTKSLGEVVLSTKPGPHFVMGIDESGYIQATSPLRRYTDMVTHWQLKASLGNEKLPFDYQDMENMILEQGTKNRMMKRLQSRQARTTSIYFIKQMYADSLAGVENAAVSALTNLSATVIPQRKGMIDRVWVNLSTFGERAVLVADSTRSYIGGETFSVELTEVAFGAQPRLVVSHRDGPSS